jgi:hypothetical protein
MYIYMNLYIYVHTYVCRYMYYLTKVIIIFQIHYNLSIGYDEVLDVYDKAKNIRLLCHIYMYTHIYTFMYIYIYLYMYIL